MATLGFTLPYPGVNNASQAQDSVIVLYRVTLDEEGLFPEGRMYWAGGEDLTAQSRLLVYTEAFGGLFCVQSSNVVTGITGNIETAYTFASPVLLSPGEYWLGYYCGNLALDPWTNQPYVTPQWADAPLETPKGFHYSTPETFPDVPFALEPAYYDGEGNYPLLLYLTDGEEEAPPEGDGEAGPGGVVGGGGYTGGLPGRSGISGGGGYE